jgi:cold shock CspA family protein
MRFKGTIKDLNDDRGFGYIGPGKGGGEVFVHIKAFARRKVRPAVRHYPLTGMPARLAA